MRLQKQPGDSGMLFLPDFQLAPTRIRRFIHFSLRPQR